MLDAPELARRLREAMDKAEPKVTSAAVAKRCQVTPQAVHGWRKTGRISKRYLATIAELTRRPLEYFLGDDPLRKVGGAALTAEEYVLVARLRDSLPAWRRYVVALSQVDRREQELLLRTMQHAGEVVDHAGKVKK